LKDRLNEILAFHTGKPFATLAADADRDFFMSAEEAKNYGLVDEVLVKRPQEK
jgi:ATP-dependent Clp protease protease subunit